MLNFFAIQAQPGKMENYVQPFFKFVCLLICLMIASQQIFAQDVVIIVEDVQGFQAEEGAEKAGNADAGTFTLEVYQGTAPSPTNSLKQIEEITVFDSAGNIVCNAFVHQKVVVLAEGLFKKDTYEFLVRSAVGVFSEQLSIE